MNSSFTYLTKRLRRAAIKSSFLFVLLLSLFSLLPVPLTAQASQLQADQGQGPSQTISAVFESFSTSNVASWKLNGFAAVNNTSHTIQLTPSSNTTYGTAWWMQRVLLSNHRSFSAYFTFYMQYGDATPADGLTFAIQTDSNSAGSTGQGLGYGGIFPSVAVEFDTYYNSGSPTYDPNANHVGIDINGNSKSIWTTTAVPTLNGGSMRYAWVDYNGATDTIEVRLGTTNVRADASVLTNTTFSSLSGGTRLEDVVGENVYVGFTAATGGSYQEHHIGSFYFNNDYISGGITPDTVTYSSYPATVSINASPTSIYATGSATSNITVCTLNSSGGIMTDQQLTLSTTAGSLSATSVTTGADGCAVVVLTSSTVQTTATITAVAQGGVNGSTSVAFTGAPPTTFSSATPGHGTYHASYSYTFIANGAPVPSYSIISGSLPSGLVLNAASGLVSGTPTATGTWNFTIQASNALGSYSQAASITVDKAGSNITINSVNPAATVYGQDYTVSVTVNPATFGTPTGSVTVNDGDNSCNITLSASSGSCSLHSLSAGGHTLSLSYSGDDNFQISSNSTSHTITAADTSIVLSTPYNPAPFGAPFHITATVAAESPSLASAYGQVQFYLNGEAFGSPVDLSGETVQSELVPAPLGTYNFTAAFLGNNNLNTSTTSSTLAQVVEKAHTTTVVTTPANPTVYGYGVTFTATVDSVLPSLATPDGSVQFKLDGVNYGAPVALNGSGQAAKTIPFTALWPTTHSITAEYSGAGNFLPSDNLSTPLFHTVIKSTPNFNFIPSQTEALAGEAISAVISVLPTPSNIGTPTGTLSVYVDGDLFAGPLTLDANGQVEISNLALLTGSHTISLQYSGDDYFAVTPSTFPLPVTISPADTTTTIIGFNPADLVTGQTTSVSVTVSPVAPASGTPTGQVQVTNGTDSCTILLASGAGSCDFTPTHPGSPDLTAHYLGDSSYKISDAAALAGPTVVKANTTISSFIFDPAAIVTGQPATFNVTIAVAAPGSGTPTGTVNISNAAGSCTITLVSGSGSCAFVPQIAGITDLTVSYSGDDDFDPVSSVLSGPVVNKAPTVISVASSNSASVYGESLIYTASISVPAPGAGSPTGLVQFYIDGQAFSEPVALVDGTAVSTANAILNTGSHGIYAVYLGDDNFAGSTSSIISQSVAAVDTTLTLFTDMNPSPYGQSVFVTARLTASNPSTAIPTGSVQFYVDGVTYGSPVLMNSSGEAVKELPWTALWVGHHSITAVYSGNTNFNPANNLSSPWDQEVVAGEVSFSALGSASPSVFGQSVSFTISVIRLGQSPILPGGTIDVAIDGTPFASGLTLDDAAQAVTGEIATLSAGYHSLTIQYSGDDNYAAFTSTLTNAHQVAKSPVSVSIDSFTPAVVVGQPVEVTVTVAAAAPGAGMPSGSVSIHNGSATCIITLNAGTGSCQFTPTSAGTFELTAEYLGDSSFLTGSGSENSGPVISPAETQTSLVAYAPATIVVGQPTTVSVAVSASTPGSGLPSGPVFIEFGAANCTATVVDGIGSCELTPTQTGLTNISIAYLGSDDYKPSSAGLVSGPSVEKASTWTLVNSPDSVLPTQSIQWTAEVFTLAPGSGTAYGFIQFYLDEQPIGAPVAMVDGAAVSAAVSGLAPGKHNVNAFYMGSADFEDSLSTTISILVNNSYYFPLIFNR